MRRSTVRTRSDSPLVQRPERPAGRPTEAPNHLHSQSAQQRILQEHVTRVASGEGSSARAVDLHQLQFRPPDGQLAAGAPASSSPPESAVQPPSGPQARADRRREEPQSAVRPIIPTKTLCGTHRRYLASSRVISGCSRAPRVWTIFVTQPLVSAGGAVRGVRGGRRAQTRQTGRRWWQFRNCRWSIALSVCRNTTPALL